MRYRTSSSGLKGIGDESLAFVGTGIRQGILDPQYTLVGRLNRSSPKGSG